MATLSIPDNEIENVFALLSGSSVKAVTEAVLELPSEVTKKVVTASYFAATGGAKPVKENVKFDRSLEAALKGTILAKSSDWNYTALAVLGHTLVRLNANTKFSAAFIEKYGVSSIWDYSDTAVGDTEDKKIKIALARTQRWDQASANKLRDYLATIY